MRGHLGDYFLDGEADRHHFAGDVQFVLGGTVHAADVKIGGEGVRNKAILDHRNGERKLEAATTSAGVEEDAALTAIDESFAWAHRGRILFVAQTGVHVGVDVSWPQLLIEQVIERTSVGVVFTKVDHDGDVSFRTCNYRLLYRSPLRASVVCRLNADHDVRIFEGHLCGGFTVHIGLVVLVFAAAHASAHDVEHGENASSGTIDDFFLEVFEVTPARAARVYHGGNSRTEGKSVGRDAVVAGIGVALPGVDEGMEVYIDKAGRDIKTLDVD